VPPEGFPKERKLHLKNNQFQSELLAYEYQLKFVIQDTEDINEVCAFCHDHDIEHSRIYLMPEGITREDWDKASHITAGLCLGSGFKMSPRLHIAIWGDERAR
jgi:7-carboxy-7-deazaguanine synthase